jgi:tetratricopeptide (TPR) repeat protein
MSQVPASPKFSRIAPQSAQPIRSRGRAARPWMFPASVSVLLIALVLVAWRTQGSVTPPGVPRFAGPPPNAPGADVVTVTDLKALREEIGGQAGRIEALRERIERMPEPKSGPASGLASPSSPDLGALRARVDALVNELTNLHGLITPLPKTTERLDERIRSLDRALGVLKDEVVILDALKVEAALRPGATLFHQRKYAQALEEFQKLQANYPQDARVWYYCALANGMATNKWEGQTQLWVNEGVVRELAGTPDAARIDAEFERLLKATGKEWLDFYRKRAER